MKSNSKFIEEELHWLQNVIVTRLKLYFNQDGSHNSIKEIPFPDYSEYKGAYPDFIKQHALNSHDRLALILAFTPILKPQLFDSFLIKNSHTEQRFVEFGCVKKNDSERIFPTMETLLFILSGDNVEDKIQWTKYFSAHFLFVKKIILTERSPLTTAILTPSAPIVETLIYERKYTPEFSLDIPARRLITMQQWDDLILDDYTMTQINEIQLWINHGERMLAEWELGKKIKPGYRALFYGPSGTGKTFTASLLGRYTGKEVYCIDLSMMVSKYIGETEKNLSKLFDIAENRNWILFFDEADALFGKRTGIKDAHDRYANQEVAYLLQRVEAYNGLIVLATNLKSNIDEAFARRFQNVVRFSIPDAEMRLRLWQRTFSPKTSFEKEVNLKEIAQKYAITGGTILNVVQYASLKAISRNNNIILNNDIIKGIRKEYYKLGKTPN